VWRRARTPYRLAYDPDLVPPLDLMRQEGIDVLEEWFRWGEEWSMLLRVYGAIARDSRVMEIGCGLGRVAFPLRYVIGSEGRYEGFEIARHKVEWLSDTFHRAYPHFCFTWANVRNTYYNPAGAVAANEYRFPYDDASFDLAYAASVFTHMLPDATARYFRETARVLRPGGRALFSCFLLDHYRPGAARPYGFARADFNFDHAFGDHGNDFRIVVPENPEQMTAYRLALLQRYATDARLEVAQMLPGLWSGASTSWIGAQDVLVLQRR
jgi:SAM-dependent methyltransferase